jgi:hypothetical protein
MFNLKEFGVTDKELNFESVKTAIPTTIQEVKGFCFSNDSFHDNLSCTQEFFPKTTFCKGFLAI